MNVIAAHSAKEMKVVAVVEATTLRSRATTCDFFIVALPYTSLQYATFVTSAISCLRLLPEVSAASIERIDTSQEWSDVLMGME